jgi:hypothetical protein
LGLIFVRGFPVGVRTSPVVSVVRGTWDRTHVRESPCDIGGTLELSRRDTPRDHSPLPPRRCFAFRARHFSRCALMSLALRFQSW